MGKRPYRRRIIKTSEMEGSFWKGISVERSCYYKANMRPSINLYIYLFIGLISVDMPVQFSYPIQRKREYSNNDKPAGCCANSLHFVIVSFLTIIWRMLRTTGYLCWEEVSSIDQQGFEVLSSC